MFGLFFSEKPLETCVWVENLGILEMTDYCLEEIKADCGGNTNVLGGNKANNYIRLP